MFGSLSWYGTKFIFLDQSASMVLLTLMIHSVHAGSFCWFGSFHRHETIGCIESLFWFETIISFGSFHSPGSIEHYGSFAYGDTIARWGSFLKSGAIARNDSLHSLWYYQVWWFSHVAWYYVSTWFTVARWSYSSLWIVDYAWYYLFFWLTL